MQLGWVDFSKTDRDKVLGVIRLLQEPGVLDELGIGTIRDAFSGCFFPGISTIQTRAKYFLIVPYVLKEAGEGKYGFAVEAVLEKIDQRERECAEKLVENGKDEKGVIGSAVLSHNRWVVRAPSDIYWGGIRRFGIFRDEKLSVREYLEASLKQRDAARGKSAGNRVKRKDADDWDDADAGDFDYRSFWNLPTFTPDWFTDLKIDLFPEEADFLKCQIEIHEGDSLLAHILRQHVDVSACEDFASLSELVQHDVPEDLRHLMELANGFNQLVYLSRIRYNLMLSQGQNKRAIAEWEVYREDLAQYAAVDLEGIFLKYDVNCKLKRFLINLQKAFLENDIDAADDAIRNREIAIKGQSRAKLARAGEFNAQDWYAGGKLDYRLSEAKRIVTDIFDGEASGNV